MAQIWLEAIARLPRLDAGANWWVRNPDAGRRRPTPQLRARREQQALCREPRVLQNTGRALLGQRALP